MQNMSQQFAESGGQVGTEQEKSEQAQRKERTGQIGDGEVAGRNEGEWADI